MLSPKHLQAVQVQIVDRCNKNADICFNFLAQFLKKRGELADFALEPHASLRQNQVNYSVIHAK